MPKKRSGKNKKLKPILHIFCEGKKTEPIYLNGYLCKFHSSNRRLQVVKVEKTKKNTPVQLVEEAIKLKMDSVTPDHDIFWVVYDREAKSKYSDSLHQKALDKAKTANIQVSLTNVCFEAWLLLHVVDSTACYSSCKNLLAESPLKARLKDLGIRKYDKAEKKIFDVISSSINEAKERAKKMNSATLKSSPFSANQPHLLNPYTGVPKLLNAIDKFVKET
ncbi:MAG: RloB family protein [Colwellia sp.]|jgi:hypothetical protein